MNKEFKVVFHWSKNPDRKEELESEFVSFYNAYANATNKVIDKLNDNYHRFYGDISNQQHYDDFIHKAFLMYVYAMNEVETNFKFYLDLDSVLHGVTKEGCDVYFSLKEVKGD